MISVIFLCVCTAGVSPAKAAKVKDAAGTAAVHLGTLTKPVTRASRPHSLGRFAITNYSFVRAS